MKTVVVHTYPEDDIIEHYTDGEECPCGPIVQAVFRDDGSCAWQYIHNSLDGREKNE